MKRKLSHADKSGRPKMVDVSSKRPTQRKATAQAKVWLGPTVMATVMKNEQSSPKGPVFQTAILAGIQGAKRTSDLIPLCHPLGLDNCSISIEVEGAYVIIDAAASITAKTGVEMEALTAAAIAALTVYDMCKALSHDIRIESIQLMSKTGGKKDFMRR